MTLTTADELVHLPTGETTVRFMEIDVNGTIVRMRLSEDLAPKTVDAVWNALPFEGRAVHAQLSGDMFRMLEHLPVDVKEVESPVSYQHPGLVVYYPPVRELALCYGNARFCGHTGPVKLTPLGQIEGDLSELRGIAERLRESGAQPIRFRRAEDQASPFAHRQNKGRKVLVTFDGVQQGGTLLEDLSPQTTKALAAALTVRGRARNSPWRGQVSTVPLDGGLDIDKPESSSDTLLWPGVIYYSPSRHELSLCYGQGNTLVGAGVHEALTPVIALDGDWEPVRSKAAAHLLEGAKDISITSAG